MADPLTPRYTTKVHQATGMVAVQLDCDLVEALARMMIRAAALGCDLDSLADQILDRSITFGQ